MRTPLRLIAVSVIVLVLFSFNTSTAVASSPSPHVKISYPAAYDWPMFLGTAGHTSSVVSPAPLVNKVIAFLKLNGTIKSSPVLFNGTLFVGGGLQFHAVNASTLLRTISHHEGWNYTAGGLIVGSPAVGGGNVYFGATDGKLYAFDATLAACANLSLACHFKWSYQTGGPIYASPSYDAGKVFVGSDDGKVYAINASSGTLVWSFATGGPVRSSPAVASSEVVVGSDDGRVYFLNELNGARIQRYSTSGPVESSPALSGGIAYFGSNDSSIYAVDGTTGQTVWKFTTGGPVIASPAVANGRVYIGSTDGYFYSLLAVHNKNQLVWKTFVGAVVAPAALANGVIHKLRPTFLPTAYVASLTGELYAIALNNGSVSWALPISPNSVSSPVVAYTKVYFGDNIGNITQIGSLRGGTALVTFGMSGMMKVFHQGDSVLVGANSAWGRYGISQSLVTITDPLGVNLFTNASMQFVPGISAYNFQFSFTLSTSAAKGTYKISLLVEDANIKTGSSNPRCCGWIVVKYAFKVT